MTKLEDLAGRRFGRLVVIGFSHVPVNDKHACWLCQCDCGKQSTVSGKNLRMGKTKSCGCMSQRNKMGKRMRRRIPTYVGGEIMDDEL